MKVKSIEKIIANHTIVLYDGVCGFCDASVQFILDRNPSPSLRFVSFQSNIGQQLLQAYHVSTMPETIICIENGIVIQKSKAILTIAKYIKSPYTYLHYLRWIPSRISDSIYDIVAKHRYKIMGKNQHCRLLSQSERHFFLE